MYIVRTFVFHVLCSTAGPAARFILFVKSAGRDIACEGWGTLNGKVSTSFDLCGWWKKNTNRGVLLLRNTCKSGKVGDTGEEIIEHRQGGIPFISLSQKQPSHSFAHWMK